MATIGIVGNGYVGGATSLLGNNHPQTANEIQMFLYDKVHELCSHHDVMLKDLCDSCDFIFVCVPTPMDSDGSCSTLGVNKVVFELFNYGYSPERIIVRSTVPVGTCKELGVMFMPEFLTEKNWKEDFLNQSDWILGTNDRNDSLRDEIYSIFKKAYDNKILLNKPKIHFLTTEEAELVKYVRNCFLATKVSFFNEIYGFCEFYKIDYDRVRNATILDDRVGESHTQVPGPDGKKGFGGTCLPKDMVAFQKQLEKVSSLLGLGCGIVKSSILRNDKIDRPEKDWKENKGRTVL